MTPFEYTLFGMGEAASFAVLITFFTFYVMYAKRLKKETNLYRITVHALDLIEGKLLAHQLKVLPLSSQEVLNLMREKRELSQTLEKLKVKI